ncbi:MAG: energy-coupling factor ABC transporter permease, partial [Methanomicrobiales archaeon]|nr:energy-coupling factor ABC transporter permease [Methanomicrobiales archaeon]
ELSLAGTFPLRAGLIAMGLYHAVIGVIEGFVTVVAIRLIATARPDIVHLGPAPEQQAVT